MTSYPLRHELGVPEALWQERPLGYAELNDPAFIDEIAAEFCNRSSLLAQIHQTRRAASMSLRDLFLADEEREISLSLRVSNARIAEKAQQAFQLNHSVDPRLLERALIEALRVRAFEQGIEFSDQDLRRTIQMAAMREPDALLLALKQAQGKRVHVDANEPIPNPLFDVEGADPAAKAAHGIFPGGMNKPERAFAEFLDPTNPARCHGGCAIRKRDLGHADDIAHRPALLSRLCRWHQRPVNARQCCTGRDQGRRR